MKKQFLFVVVVTFVLLAVGCKKNPTEPEKPILSVPPSLELSLDGVSCTEAWIKVKKLNDTTFLPISLKINEKEFFHGFLAATDTILFVDSLTPNTTYTVKGIILDTLQTAKELKVTTLPTTSHNFTWQTFTIGGDAGSSFISDVAIINENNIWAVGEIYMKDSLGNPDPHAYNAVHWDGSKWEVKRITVLYRGNYITPQLYGIFALSEKEIWLSSGVPIKGDGNNWTQYHLFDMGVLTQLDGYLTKIWGSSSNDIYYVGTLGTIAHYDGKNWLKIESGTTTDLRDVWGSADGKTIWVCGISTDNYHSVLLKYEYGQSTTIWQRDGLAYVEPYGRSVGSVWMENQTIYLTSSYGVFRLRGKEPTRMPENINEYSKVIRGNAGNDILTMSSGGKTWHYNGVNWELVKKEDPNNFLISCGLRGNTAVVVGTDFSVGLGAAMIQIGRR